MPIPHSRVAQASVHYRRDDLTAMLDLALPRIWSRVEAVSLWLLVAAFWGFIIYAALVYALP